MMASLSSLLKQIRGLAWALLYVNYVDTGIEVGLACKTKRYGRVKTRSGRRGKLTWPMPRKSKSS